MNINPNYEPEIAKITATICGTDDTIEITDQKFIQNLIAMGFHPGRNNSPEDLQRILKNIPPEHHKDFLAGFNSK